MNRIVATLALALSFGALPARSQYTAKLTWTPSPDAAGNPSLTYNVYRAATCAGQFTKINAGSVTTTTYVDPSVAVGAVYCYRVTAFLNGVESQPSNLEIAAVPPPSNRQSACGHHGPIVGWLRCLATRPKKGLS
jgi:fibronectin type 3 domain-containing protein